ncbi:unnamed protein product [Brachionus calyciflorus]|uniref:Cyclin-like domain-containing protein n=1 Tax=Brachionus calyciflorus TaxID=104777 RepID=A0A813N182_9BILA|nr:unnamed protein product [Brachionus calyciflorus]
MLKLRGFSFERLFELLKDAYMKSSICGIERKCLSSNNDTDFVKANERDEMVAFLLEVCDRQDMGLSVETFGLFVSLLDRFLYTYKVKSKYLECLSVACLYIACKVKEEDERVSVTSEFLLDCEAKCSIAELLRMEQMVLSKFEWSINDTTSVDFLHIFYALIVNAFKKVEEAIKNSEKVKRVWKFLGSATNSLISDGSLYPPADLDFLEDAENQLKQCLCVNDLTNAYKPHILAFSIISLQMDKVFQTTTTEEIKASLNETLALIKINCKINYELVDKCKEELRSHLASVETNKNLFENYFDEYYKWKIQSLRLSSKFASPLSAVNIQLDAIKEEEEEEEMKQNYEIHMEESCDASDYVMKKEKDSPKTQIKFFENVKFGSFSYADILSGTKKRKLSENSCQDEEIDYD